jgi:N-acetylneuraminate synthase
MDAIKSFSVGDKEIGPEDPCLIIGEVGLAHDGSLGTAHAFIDAIAEAGADAVKFQTHIAAAESTPAEPWRVKFSHQDSSRYDYWERTAFTEEQWRGLADHAQQQGLIFLSSPFSIEAVELLARVGMAAWKIPSGEVSNTPLLQRIGETGHPILLSSGMSSLGETDGAVQLFKRQSAPVAVLQCTSAYPCPPESMGLNMIPFYRERYSCPVGLSDHSGTIYAGLAAAALGIDVLEVHVTLSREMFGPDVVASVTTAELDQLVRGIRFIEEMSANPVDKEAMAMEMEPLRDLFTKSVVARVELPAGTMIGPEHLAVKKPGTGMPAASIPSLIGRRLRRAIDSDELLAEEDLE